MKLAAESTIQQAIEVVSVALEKAGITAVLVGGACATIYSGGMYTSEDLDLIIQSAPTRMMLDNAMASIGFARREAQYFHTKSDFFVEFPRGPLSIGRDVRIRSIRLKVGRSRIRALSPTDSCRDRLAAFYHWNDRQSLDVAVAIAARHRVDLAAIRNWSINENARDRFEEFRRELKHVRRRRRASARPRRSTPKRLAASPERKKD